MWELLSLSVHDAVVDVLGLLHEGLPLFVEDEPWPPPLFLERLFLYAFLAFGGHGSFSGLLGELPDAFRERLEGLRDGALRAVLGLLVASFSCHGIHRVLSLEGLPCEYFRSEISSAIDSCRWMNCEVHPSTLVAG